nr:hypothetical protein [Micromonospora sp. DSM 115978]
MHVRKIGRANPADGVRPATRQRSAKARFATAIVAVSAVAAVLVGCDTGGSATGAAPACPPAPGVTDDRVTLGMIFTNSGLTTELFRAARSGIQA